MTLDELKEYVACLSTLKIGDWVYGHLTHNKSRAFRACVVAKNPHKLPSHLLVDSLLNSTLVKAITKPVGLVLLATTHELDSTVVFLPQYQLSNATRSLLTKDVIDSIGYRKYDRFKTLNGGITITRITRS